MGGGGIANIGGGGRGRSGRSLRVLDDPGVAPRTNVSDVELLPSISCLALLRSETEAESEESHKSSTCTV